MWIKYEQDLLKSDTANNDNWDGAYTAWNPFLQFSGLIFNFKTWVKNILNQHFKV